MEKNQTDSHDMQDGIYRMIHSDQLEEMTTMGWRVVDGSVSQGVFLIRLDRDSDGGQAEMAHMSKLLVERRIELDQREASLKEQEWQKRERAQKLADAKLRAARARAQAEESKVWKDLHAQWFSLLMDAVTSWQEHTEKMRAQCGAKSWDEIVNLNDIRIPPGHDRLYSDYLSELQETKNEIEKAREARAEKEKSK